MKYRKLVYMGIIMISAMLVAGGVSFLQSRSERQFQPIGQAKAVEEPYYGSAAVNRAKPAGIVAGIYVKTQGILVLEVTRVWNKTTCREPAKGILKKGDYLLSCNGTKLRRKEDLTKALQASGGKAVSLRIRRDGKIKNVKIRPVKQEGEYHIGCWVRDDMAGIGTITLCTPQNTFVALGHCISDMDLNEKVQIREGSLHPCSLTDIRKGKKNQPGALIGYIDYRPEEPVGTILKNSPNGIFGRLLQQSCLLEEEDYLPLAKRSQVHTGKAELISNLTGKRQRYTMKITHINHFNRMDSKGFVIEITDPRLVKETGGIVQGMSGSPIIQDGRIVGAVTHVLVHDPKMGYGIFIRDMLKNTVGNS